MARPTCRLMTVVLSVLVGGLILWYRSSSKNEELYGGQESLHPDGAYRERWDSYHHRQSRQNNSLPANITSKLNATQGQGRGLTCRRLWKDKSNWFNDKFQETLHPVWMKENMKLDDKVAKWWLGLQSNANNDYLSELERTFSVIPSPDRFLTRNQSSCLRCAVVGNSGNLRNSGYGDLIDSHDIVIRINQAKTKGFEKDVGRKETHRLMYPESFIDIPPQTHFILLNFKVLDITWVRSALTTGEITRTYTSVRSKINVPRSNILLYNPTLMHHIYNDWIDRKGRYPSSGSLAIFFAVQFCDEVSAFGMGANSQGFWDHYWQRGDGKGNSAFLKTHVHDSVHEYEVIANLAEQNIITLHKGVR